MSGVNNHPGEAHLIIETLVYCVDIIVRRLTDLNGKRSYELYFRVSDKLAEYLPRSVISEVFERLCD